MLFAEPASLHSVRLLRVGLYSNSVTFQGSTSAVTYELHFGGDRYIDQFLLYRTDAGWRVVAKTTAVQ
ncbi:nuclear transport factor 2 family protein [Sphingopyxis sp. LARHCG72]